MAPLSLIFTKETSSATHGCRNYTEDRSFSAATNQKRLEQLRQCAAGARCGIRRFAQDAPHAVIALALLPLLRLPADS